MLNDVATPEGADARPREINRRTIAKGVAWSVPVIVMATAAPAAAASTLVAVSPTARFIPTASNGRATVVVTITVTSSSTGKSVTFGNLGQGGSTFGFAGATTFALATGSNTFSLTTTASETIAPVGSTVSYTVTGEPTAVVPVAIAPVTTLTGVTASGAGNTVTFTGSFSPRNPNSRLVVQSITSPAKKNNETVRPDGPLPWGGLPMSVDDIGTAASVTLQRPSDPPYLDVDWAHTTITGTFDNIPFTRIVNAT